MFKRFMSLVLSLFMILAFIPIRVEADDHFSMWVGGYSILTTDETSMDDPGYMGTWDYEFIVDSGVRYGKLTLKNTTIRRTYENTGIYLPGEESVIYVLNINLNGGSNTIETPRCVYVDRHDILINGGGSLNLQGYGYGVSSMSSLEAEGCRLTISDGSSVFVSGGNVSGIVSGPLDVKGSSSLNVTTSASYGINCNSMSISGNSSVTGIGSSYGVMSSNAITISDNSYLYAKGRVAAINAERGITLDDGLEIIKPEGGSISSDRRTIQNSDGTTATEVLIGKKQTITTDAQDPSGQHIGGAVLTGAGAYANGQTATVTATPSTGYRFVNWTENGTEVSTDANYSFTVANDRNLVANFELITHTITATASPESDGTVTGGGTYSYGTEVSLIATPDEGCNFIKWSDGSTDNPRSIIVTQDQTFTALFERPKYTIDFKNYDDSILQTGSIPYGETPEYTGDTPVKPDTERYSYNFLAWTPAIVPVTENAIYTATYNETAKKYTIKFLNGDGTELQSGLVAYGETPEYVGETPTKPTTPQYTYSFSGWDTDIVPVTGNKTYVATYNSTVNEYTIKFVNDDGTELQSDVLPYGETPVYIGKTPTKSSTDQYTYNFKGWHTSILPVEGDAIYIATYSAEARKHDNNPNSTDSGNTSVSGDYDSQIKNKKISDTSNTTHTPQTGDKINFLPWFVLILISFVSLLLCFALSKKRTSKYKHYR